LDTPIPWEEYTLTLHPLPGHTLYAVAIEFEADGKRFLATGDQYQGDEGWEPNYVYPNRFRVGDYVLSAALYRRINPDVILSGHWPPLWVKPGYFDRLDRAGAELDRLHPRPATGRAGPGRGGLPGPPDALSGLGARRGTGRFTVEVRNPFPRPRRP
jgi:glyoxylase-like metal-dependent hydrolase (beta-lactamase superfamily II)